MRYAALWRRFAPRTAFQSGNDPIGSPVPHRAERWELGWSSRNPIEAFGERPARLERPSRQTSPARDGPSLNVGLVHELLERRVAALADRVAMGQEEGVEVLRE